MIPSAPRTFARSAPVPHPPQAATAAPPAHPTADPPPTKKPRGNPTLHLVPRCGARTRAGCPCRAPAVRGKRRCRMHGGRSTGPRTPKGLEDMRAARTIHGRAGAGPRAEKRYRLTMLRRNRVKRAATNYQAHLPPVFLARLYGHPPELAPPPKPTGGITAQQDRIRYRAVLAALAPWKQAIATARAAHLAARAAQPHAPVRRPADTAATTRANRPPAAPAMALPLHAAQNATQAGRPTPPRPAPD